MLKNTFKKSFSTRDVFHSLDSMVELVELDKPKNSADLKVDGQKRVWESFFHSSKTLPQMQ